MSDAKSCHSRNYYGRSDDWFEPLWQLLDVCDAVGHSDGEDLTKDGVSRLTANKMLDIHYYYGSIK